MKFTLLGGYSVEDVSRTASEKAFVVRYAGLDIGFITKIRDNQSTKNPFKALGPLPKTQDGTRQILGFFYDAKHNFPDTDDGYAPSRSSVKPHQAALDKVVSRFCA